MSFQQFNLVCGPVEVLNLNQFAELVFNKHAKKVYDQLLDEAMEKIVLSDTINSAEIIPIDVNPVEYYEWSNSAYALGDVFGEDVNTLKRVANFLPVNVGGKEDIIDFIAKNIEKQIIVKYHSEEDNFLSDMNYVALQAMENFAEPTHVVRVAPKRWVALNPEDIQVNITVANSIVYMCIYSLKRTTFYATEITHDAKI